ncbi:MAG: hypothetical protein PHP49_04240 [Bacilli bacterium]|nr:hypothetical protein [Bacilli bacterium]
MRKVFLYLYPVREYSDVIYKATNYDDLGLQNPFEVLNECIQKRYRQNGFEIIFIMYPDKEIYGIDVKQDDKVLYTDITFKEAIGYDIEGNKKEVTDIKYPSEEDIFNKVGKVDRIVIGGYHHSDCVRRVAEYFNERGINTLVDLDLTDLFFNRYYEDDFDIENYDLKIKKDNLMTIFVELFGVDYKAKFDEIYGSPIFQFNDEVFEEKIKKL